MHLHRTKIHQRSTDPAKNEIEERKKECEVGRDWGNEGRGEGAING